jgi:zinc/manganese transport system substrate-binding protein
MVTPSIKRRLTSRAVLIALWAALALVAAPARAALNVLACEPEWGALARELAGDRATVYVATTAMQDVHHIQARPSLIAMARRADLLVCTGADLEIGWLPVLVRESGNARIQPGQPGAFEASAYVAMIEVPARVSRSEGDVHPMGNPHIHTDPRNIARVAVALADRLATLDPENAGAYRERHAAFAARWKDAVARWEVRARPLSGVRIVEHHKAFSYFFAWLGVEAIGYLEAKPGIEPSTGHLAALVERQRTVPARMVVRASYSDPRASEWFAGRAGIPAVMLPFSVGGSEASTNLYAWFDDLIGRLLEAAK